MIYTRKRRLALLAAVATALAIPAAGTTAASSKLAAAKGEGSLNMVAWEGYLDKSWVKPFQAQTGCTIHAKYAGSSDEMVTLMRQGGGGQYDMVSASGDASLRLIYGGDVAKIDVNRVPAWKQFHPAFQSPAGNTVKTIKPQSQGFQLMTTSRNRAAWITSLAPATRPGSSRSSRRSGCVTSPQKVTRTPNRTTRGVGNGFH